MPIVAVIDGVKIQFYPGEHPPPHFHATIAEFTAQIRIDPVVILRGSLPPNKVANVIDWAQQRRQPLMEAWNAMAAGHKPGKVQ